MSIISIKITARKMISYEVNGLPLFFYSLMSVLIIIFWKLGKLEAMGIVGAFAFMWAIGFFFYAIGEKLPIWREYVGGGLIMAFIGSAVLVHMNIISADEADFLKAAVIDNKLLYLLLVALVGASVLSVPRKVLLKSLVLYVPIIIAGITFAMALGVAAGTFFGIAPGKIITMYVLPIMGGGNGAGAIPMAEIYADVTGKDESVYYSFAISILTLGNMIAILIAASLNKLGKIYPSLTGNGKLLNTPDEIELDDEPIIEHSKLNTQGSLFFVTSILLLCALLYSIIPAVHLFAWSVIIFMLFNALDILSSEIKQSMQAFSEWGMKVFLILVLVAIGLKTDLNTLIDTFNIANITIAFFIVFGAALGTGLTAKLFKCYPIEAAISAGLCMANRGGSGDLEVLGAAKRMELFPYSQISSRIGGGIVLMLAGYLFRILV
ncbi:MAG: 2-hydroxycarboxylate transporter family protein [Colwellia sp.]|nr:2-hydroxycarboxylate transporter family protein [Colwellia sp.]